MGYLTYTVYFAFAVFTYKLPNYKTTNLQIFKSTKHETTRFKMLIYKSITITSEVDMKNKDYNGDTVYGFLQKPTMEQ